MSNQFIRKCSLIVYGASAIGNPSPSAPITTSANGIPQITVTPAATLPGLDLSQFKIEFKVDAMDINTPPTARIRVHNLAFSTVKQIQSEFQNVVLQAGYVNGNFGVIFQGSIIRTRVGRLSNVETFLDIMASNLDAVYNFGIVSKSGSKLNPQDQLNLVQQGIADSPVGKVTPNALAAGVSYGYVPQSFSTGGILPRGKVMFGLARKYFNQLADSQSCTWSIGPDGKVNIIEYSGYLPGTPVLINAATGMVGIPEATLQGIEVTTLLNPNIKTGTLIQLDNQTINTTQVQSALGFPGYSDVLSGLFANTSTDGKYRVIVAEHQGDTRGEGADWLTHITALSLDASAASGGGQVQPYGWGLAPTS